jgi:hypothetical protein
MDIRFQHDTVKAGAEVVLLIALTNATASKIELYRATTGHHPYTIRLLDSKAKVPPLTAFGKALRGEPLLREGSKVPGIILDQGFWLTIAAGQTREDRLYLFEEFDLSQPGVYTVQLERIDPATKIVVKSNADTLTVSK